MRYYQGDEEYQLLDSIAGSLFHSTNYLRAFFLSGT